MLVCQKNFHDCYSDIIYRHDALQQEIRALHAFLILSLLPYLLCCMFMYSVVPL